jgi:hypothetical protein
LTVTEKYGDFSGQNIMSFEAATMYILFSEIYQKRIKKKVEKKRRSLLCVGSVTIHLAKVVFD